MKNPNARARNQAIKGEQKDHKISKGMQGVKEECDEIFFVVTVNKKEGVCEGEKKVKKNLFK